MVEQKLAKCRLAKAEPLLISNIKKRLHELWQDVEISWIAGILFSKRANGVKLDKNFIFISLDRLWD